MLLSSRHWLKLLVRRVQPCRSDNLRFAMRTASLCLAPLTHRPGRHKGQSYEPPICSGLIGVLKKGRNESTQMFIGKVY